MERTLNIGGTKLIYIPVSEVINRLNKILGVNNWSMTVIKCDRDATDIDFVVAHVRLQYTSPNGVVVRDGIGGQKIKRTKQGSIVDLGNEFKGAISDALKKAAQTLGVGLYLARSEDAIEIENVIDSQPAPKDKVAEPSETTNHKWQAFLAISKQLSDDQRNQLKELWAEYTDAERYSGNSVMFAMFAYPLVCKRIASDAKNSISSSVAEFAGVSFSVVNINI